MNTKYVTSLELSKQLKEAGIPQESEWYWVRNSRDEIKLVDKTKTAGGESTYWYEVIASAFHVGELGEMLPLRLIINNEYVYFTNTRSLMKYKNPWECQIHLSDSHTIYYFEIGDTEAEARGKMLLYLKKEGLV